MWIYDVATVTCRVVLSLLLSGSGLLQRGLPCSGELRHGLNARKDPERLEETCADEDLLFCSDCACRFLCGGKNWHVCNVPHNGDDFYWITVNMCFERDEQINNDCFFFFMVSLFCVSYTWESRLRSSRNMEKG